MPPQPRPFFETLRSLLDADGRVTLGELLDAAGEQTYGLLMLLLALPSLVPGLNVGMAPVAGLGILALGLQLAWGTPHPWVPRRIQAQPLHKGRIKQALAALEGQLARIRWRRPRVRPLNRRWVGLVAAWTGFLLALPVPLPFGNQLPAAILCLLGAALLEDRPGWSWLATAAALGNTLYFASSYGLIVRYTLKAFHAIMP